MSVIRKIPGPGGSEMHVRDEDFDPVEEKWSVYRLQDGGTVRLRATAMTISRVLDAQGKPTYQADGQPAILVQHQIQIVASDG